MLKWYLRKWESKGIKMYKYKGKREDKNINLPKYN